MFLSDCTKSRGNHYVDINNKTVYTVNIYFSLKNIIAKNHPSIEKPTLFQCIGFSPVSRKRKIQVRSYKRKATGMCISGEAVTMTRESDLGATWTRYKFHFSTCPKTSDSYLSFFFLV